MKICGFDRSSATILLSKEELVWLNNALNEVCHGIHVEEFETRLGATKEELRTQLDKIGELIDKMDQT